ncbi:outer membrane protein with beta-barrel domain [Novosphingobium sp. PhB57]|jgi:opacity protein-like surface antigen|uniref:outer membrane protein n=1 Tax=unclassified Novosphingobium TaxID=2644732 RepID=UPI00104CE295|nr:MULTISPECIES: outer membrane beta-barrel protein [unclassified Novosphingobium]TCU58677.1 outer membrane protein with beta-barrel domain [Novosphingobium sp. PhB57]TDW61682.1 outer membrane protein with beta-barrel domain [Novosphingobium sp. PhB55]
MRIALVSLAAVAAVAAASPAFANEARVEARTGVIWDGSDSDAVAGVAAGYDYDLGEKFFVGVEGSADKVLTDNTRVSWGVGGRAGVKVTPSTKLYAASTWQSKFTKYGNSAVGVGGGLQQDLNDKFYGKVEYKHLLVGDNTPDADVGLVGVGMKF